MQGIRHARIGRLGLSVAAAVAVSAAGAGSANGAVTALYELDGASGDVADTAGDNPGTVAGSPERGVDGVFGDAFDFSGEGNGVNLGTDPGVQPTGSFTNTFWLNVDEVTDADRYTRFVGAIARDSGGDKSGYRSFFSGNTEAEDGGTKVAFVAFNDGNRIAGDNAFNPEDGTWYFVANRLDVDGNTSITMVEQMEGEATASDFAPDSSRATQSGLNYISETRLAQAPGGGNSLNGRLDDVAFFDSALSNQELANIYNNGAASAVPEPASLALLGLGGLTLLGRRRRLAG